MWDTWTIEKNGSSINVKKKPSGFSCEIKLQDSKLKRFLGQSKNISRHLVTTRATRNDHENDKCMQISIGIYRWQWIAKAMSTRVSRKYRGISSESSDEAGDLPEWGLSGRSSYENLELELAKSFTPNRREIRVPEYRRGVKDPNTTQWRRGPVRHTSMLVKVL